MKTASDQSHSAEFRDAAVEQMTKPGRGISAAARSKSTKRMERPVDHKRVARVVREHGLQSAKRGRFQDVTTDSRHAYPVAPKF